MDTSEIYPLQEKIFVLAFILACFPLYLRDFVFPRLLACLVTKTETETKRDQRRVASSLYQTHLHCQETTVVEQELYSVCKSSETEKSAARE